jgi:hypothetical protein
MDPQLLQFLSTQAGSGVTNQAPQAQGKTSMSDLASLFQISASGTGKADAKKALIMQMLQDQMKLPQSNFASSLTVPQPYQAGGN